MVTQMLLAMKAVCLKKGGGYYFVPALEQTNLLAMQAMISSLPCFEGGETFFCALGIFDAGQSKTDLLKAISTGIMDEIANLEKDMERVEESRTTRPKTVEERLAWYREVRNKADLYSSFLGINQSKIEAAIQTLEQSARNLLLRETTTPERQEASSHATLFTFTNASSGATLIT